MTEHADGVRVRSAAESALGAAGGDVAELAEPVLGVFVRQRCQVVEQSFTVLVVD